MRQTNQDNQQQHIFKKGKVIALAEVKTFEYPNCIVRVHFPDLTEDERKKRMNDLKKATARFMQAVEKERRSRK